MTIASRSRIPTDTSVDRREIPRLERRAQQQDEGGRDHDVNGGSGDRHQKFFPRLLGNAFELRHAADRQQCHRRCGHAEPARHEDVAELMGHHARKKQQHEHQRIPCCFSSARRVAGEENPGQEQQECDVDPYRGARNRADID